MLLQHALKTAEPIAATCRTKTPALGLAEEPHMMCAATNQQHQCTDSDRTDSQQQPSPFNCTAHHLRSTAPHHLCVICLRAWGNSLHIQQSGTSRAQSQSSGHFSNMVPLLQDSYTAQLNGAGTCSTTSRSRQHPLCIACLPIQLHVQSPPCCWS